MIMIKRITNCFLLSLFILLTAIAAGAQQPEKGTPEKSTFEALLEKLKKGDTRVDYRELRMAYAGSPQYSPYGDDSDARDAMFSALNNGAYDKSIEFVEKLLRKEFVDIDAHMVASIAYAKMKNAEKARYHREIVKGLIRSILDSGDGITPEAAFQVISLREEGAVHGALGLRQHSQALIKENGHSYDKLSLIDPGTNKETVVYFNVDRPMNWLNKALSK